MLRAKLNKLSSYNKFALFLVSASSIGLAASFMLTLEKLSLLKNPATSLICDLNPVVSCGSVIMSKQAEAFGFANPLIGLIGFSVIITIGMGILAGAKYKRWFWLGLETGAILGVLFCHWLLYQSVFVIQALCPFCMVVWAVTIALLVYVTRFNLQEGNIKPPKALKWLSDLIAHYTWMVVASWYLIIALLILNHFWYYWKTLF
ncbi:vitamin K epoxide reductase family protein, partial [Candidatus Saccharibacteria bacterium]|nr:vitamin K epoxide reductase family protein [Candidatus Saccharibacteria bacterium]